MSEKGIDSPTPRDCFQHCPRCGAAGLGDSQSNSVNCPRCGFRFFFNPAIAAGAIISDDTGRILLIRRAKDPGKGKLAIPGGFVDHGETAENAVRREIKEETGLELGALRYIGSFPNLYHYGGIIYPVLDLFFAARVKSLDAARALDDVADVERVDPGQLSLEDIAFDSMRSALREYVSNSAGW